VKPVPALDRETRFVEPFLIIGIVTQAANPQPVTAFT
jgi:hypothetical protein